MIKKKTGQSVDALQSVHVPSAALQTTASEDYWARSEYQSPYKSIELFSPKILIPTISIEISISMQYVINLLASKQEVIEQTSLYNSIYYSIIKINVRLYLTF